MDLTPFLEKLFVLILLSHAADVSRAAIDRQRLK
jgi:hypothetical protein